MKKSKRNKKAKTKDLITTGVMLMDLIKLVEENAEQIDKVTSMTITSHNISKMLIQNNSEFSLTLLCVPLYSTYNTCGGLNENANKRLSNNAKCRPLNSI